MKRAAGQRDRTAKPVLHLSVQYASRCEAPSRAQVRRWAESTLRHSAAGDEGIAEARLTVRFVDADEGRDLNRTYRGKDYATNVLTFPYDDGASPFMEADLVLCMPVVEAEALAQRKAIAAHCGHLVIHGVLHARGHDHETPAEAEAMERIERDVLARFRIADPYRPTG